jgi:hypothetical protein
MDNIVTREGGTHCDVNLDGLALLEAQVQFGTFIWVLGLFCKLTLLFHPPGKEQEEKGEAGEAAALRSLTPPQSTGEASLEAGLESRIQTPAVTLSSYMHVDPI